MQAGTNVVEHLKRRLLGALNDQKQVTNEKAAGDAILSIQSATFTKESLQASRLGLLINEVRRKNQVDFPEFAKQCRSLIKEWQKLLSPSAVDKKRSSFSATKDDEASSESVVLVECNKWNVTGDDRDRPTTSQGQQQRHLLVAASCEEGDSAAAATVAAADASLASSPLRIRIKLGQCGDKAATIVKSETWHGCEAAPATANGRPPPSNRVSIEQAANRRKRKWDHSDGADSCSGSTTTTTTVGKVLNGGDEETTQQPSPVDSERQSRLKSTAALVEEMTKSYSNDLAAATRQHVVPMTSQSEDEGDDDDDDDEEERTVRRQKALFERQRQMVIRNQHEGGGGGGGGGGILATVGNIAAADRELTVNKSVMLQRFLDAIDMMSDSSPAPDASVSPAEADKAEGGGDDDGKSPQAAEDDRKALKTASDYSSAGSGEQSSATDEDDDDDGSTDDEDDDLQLVIQDTVDWDQFVLPPLQEAICKAEMESEETVQTELVDGYERSGADSAELTGDDAWPSFEPEDIARSALMHCSEQSVRLHSRVLSRRENGRQLLIMPFVDIGLPDFVDYNTSLRRGGGGGGGTAEEQHDVGCNRCSLLLRWDELGW